MSEKIYVVGYTIGEYSDRREETIIAFKSEHQANTLKVSLEECAKYINNQSKIFRDDCKTYDANMAEPSRPVFPHKHSKPEWSAMSHEQWKKDLIVPYEATLKEIKLVENKIWNDRVAWQQKWWKDSYDSAPEHIKEADKYCKFFENHLYDDPQFYVFELELR